MARGIRKHIIKDRKIALAKLREIGAENIRGVSGVREAWNPSTNEITEYHTVYHHVRAEVEISVPVFNWFLEKGIFQFAD